MAQTEADDAPQGARPLLYAPLPGDAHALGDVMESVDGTPRVVGSGAEFGKALKKLDTLLLIVLTEEAADAATGVAIRDAMATEPNWSRVPIIALVDDAESPPPACDVLSRMKDPPPVLLLKRPVPRATFASALRAKRENRLRQFRTRALLNELEDAERHKDFLLRELRHRTGNSFAVLQAMLSLTARRATDVSGLVGDFSDRLRSLTRTHMAMGQSDAQALSLDEIVRDNVGPYCFLADQLRLDGPPIAIEGHAVFNLAIVIHELATNSAKYGALTREGGRIDVGWSVDPEDGRLRVSWEESGGPRVEAPRRRGTGSEVIGSLSGEDVEMDFRPEGLRWTTKMPKDAFRPMDDAADAS